MQRKRRTFLDWVLGLLPCRRCNWHRIKKVSCSVFVLCFASTVWAQSVQVAVAANFAGPAQQIADSFEKASGYHAQLSIGATGKFFAQIKNGAPFDILLSADQSTPEQLEHDHLAVINSRFAYAVGKLALWSADAHLIDGEGSILKSGLFTHIAIASPQLAPYGAAALETLRSLQLADVLKSKIVQGESIGQTYAFVVSGNAEIGFVALSQIWHEGQLQSGSLWVVPQNLYTPLRQDAVLLWHGKDNPGALAFLTYLKTSAAKKIIHAYGYD